MRLLGASHTLLDKFIVDFVFYKQARTCTASLALIEKEREMAAFDRLIHFGVCEYDVRALAAKLQTDPFEIGPARLPPESDDPLLPNR